MHHLPAPDLLSESLGATVVVGPCALSQSSLAETGGCLVTGNVAVPFSRGLANSWGNKSGEQCKDLKRTNSCWRKKQRVRQQCYSDTAEDNTTEGRAVRRSKGKMFKVWKDLCFIVYLVVMQFHSVCWTRSIFSKLLQIFSSSFFSDFLFLRVLCYPSIYLTLYLLFRSSFYCRILHKMRAVLVSINSYCPEAIVALVSTADSMCSVPCYLLFQVEDVTSSAYLNYFSYYHKCCRYRQKSSLESVRKNSLVCSWSDNGETVIIFCRLFPVEVLIWVLF